MESVDQIILLMSKHKSITAKDLAREMKLKPISVRYHLTNLMASQDVQRVSVVHTGHAGRPSYTYRLTARGRARADKLTKEVSSHLIRTA